MAGPAPAPSGPPTIALPIIVKIPVPTTAPMPRIIRSNALSVFLIQTFWQFQLPRQ